MAVASDLRGSSEESLDQLLDELAGRLGSGDAAATTGDELLSVAGLIRREGSLRRALVDPSLPAEVKQGLLRELLGDEIGEVARDLSSSAVGKRWTAGRHLAEALSELGVHAVVRSADADNDPQRVAEELFTVRRAIQQSPELRNALADRSYGAEAKMQLVRSMLGDGAASATVRLVEQAIVSDHRTVELALEYFQRVAAAAHDRRVATVTVASELSDGEVDRLASALTELYGTGIQVNTVVNPAVIGGVRVEIGDDVIDGTVSARLAEAERLVAG